MRGRWCIGMPQKLPELALTSAPLPQVSEVKRAKSKILTDIAFNSKQLGRKIQVRPDISGFPFRVSAVTGGNWIHFRASMNLVDDPAEARQIWQEIKHRRYTAYEELRESRRTQRDWRKNDTLRRFRRGDTGLWDLTVIADVILDDGTYLDEVVCYNGRALGIDAGGWTGFLPFTECAETKGRRIVNFLEWKWRHRVPLIGRILRHRWARKNGVVPQRPGWVPIL